MSMKFCVIRIKELRKTTLGNHVDALYFTIQYLGAVVLLCPVQDVSPISSFLARPGSILGPFVGSVDKLIQSHVQPCDGGFICMICGRRISHFVNMRRHVREVHLSSAAEYRCPPCDKDFRNRTAIYDHIRKHHPEWKGVDYARFKVS